MAKVNIVGEAVVITSSMKLEDLVKVKKYRPDALVLKGGEDGKEPVFRIGVNENGTGCINQYGAEFSSASHDAEKLATITIIADKDVENIRETVADVLGAGIINLNKLEAKLPEVLREIDAERATVLSSISML